MQIVTGHNPAALVSYAASELQRYISDLFNIDAAIVTEAGDSDKTAFLIADDAPANDQTFILRRDGNNIVAAGGSPKATMWAVYELVEQWGVTYTLHGDILPDDVGAPGPGDFAWPNVDQTFTPNLTNRCWRLINDFCCGPESWGLAEYKRFLDQIAKMKYNEIFLSFWPWQSYIHFAFNGVEKSSAMSWFGFDYPIEDDTAGKEIFDGATEFENPDFAGITDYKQRYEAARAQAQGIFEHARARGMITGMAIQMFEYPREFIDALPGAEVAAQCGHVTCRPGKNHAPDDPMVIDMARTILRTYVETYPDADYVCINMPEHREILDQAPQAWARLDEKFGINQVMSLEDAIESASKRTLIHGGGERQISRVKGDAIALDVLTTVLEDRSVLQRHGREPIQVVYSCLVDELEPIVPCLGPEGSGLLVFIDYTARRVVDQIEAMDYAPTDQMGCRFIFTLADDNVGVLPQLATRPLHEIATKLRANSWLGFSTRYWMIGDLDPTAHYLARSSWENGLTPDDAFRSLAQKVCGQDSAQPLFRVWDIIEDVTDTFDKEGMGYAFPVENMIMHHYNNADIHNDAMRRVREQYEEAFALAVEAHDNSREAGRTFAAYFVERLRFAMQYMDSCVELRAAGIAHRDDKIDQAATHIEKAIALVRQSAETYAAVVKDNSDRGVIATLHRECYRRMRDKLAGLRGV
jgi:hypothetical protein